MINFLLAVIFIYQLNFLSCKPSSTRDDYTKPEHTESKKNTPGKGYEIKEVTGKLFVPWSIVFTDSERMLVTERTGTLRVIQNGILADKPLKKFDEVASNGEEGLMGLALDPGYRNNKFIYVSYAYDKNKDLKVKVVRFKDEGSDLTEEKLIIDNLPAARYHAGCRIKFGPD